MVIIEKIDGNKLCPSEPSGPKDGMGQVLRRKILDFDSGPQEQRRCGQAHGARSFTVRLPDDRLEFLLTIAIFFALLFGLYVGLIAS